MKKKLTILFLQISLVWMGVSVLVDSVNATKQNSERALDLIRQARAAIGGEGAVKNVQNLSMKGKSHRIVKVKNQSDRELNGDFEMAVILPDQIIRMEKFGVEEGSAKGETSNEETDSLERDVIVELDEEGASGEKGNFEAARMSGDNEMYRFTLGFLLTPPKGANLSYDYSGEENVDGRAANVIIVTSGSKTIVRLYLDKQSNLPVMMSYKGFAPHMPELFDGAEKFGNAKVFERVPAGKDVVIMREPSQNESKELKDKVTFSRKIEKGEIPAEGQMYRFKLEEPAEADIQLKFADYRTVNGIKLPHQLTEIVNGNVSLTTTVESYEINAPNVAERFKQNHMRIRVKHPE